MVSADEFRRAVSVDLAWSGFVGLHEPVLVLCSAHETQSFPAALCISDNLGLFIVRQRAREKTGRTGV